MKKSTITDLPNDIRDAVPEDQRNKKVLQIIKEAEAGEFHDFQNHKYATPKMQLAGMLGTVAAELYNEKLGAIRVDVIKGIYDESHPLKQKP